MATTTIDALPQAVMIADQDLLVLNQYQANGTYVTLKMTTTQLASFILNIIGIITPQPGFVSLRQFRTALAEQSELVTVDQAVSADITNAVNIQWNSGSLVVPDDDLASFVQTTLSYSDAQMTALFALAATMPF